MNYTYKVDMEGMKGEVIIKAPSYIEKMKTIKECNFAIAEDGSVKIDSSVYDSAILLAQKVIESTVKVDVKVGAKTYTSIDELMSDATCDPLIQALSNIFVEGVKLGES